MLIQCLRPDKKPIEGLPLYPKIQLTLIPFPRLILLTVSAGPPMVMEV